MPTNNEKAARREVRRKIIESAKKLRENQGIVFNPNVLVRRVGLVSTPNLKKNNEYNEYIIPTRTVNWGSRYNTYETPMNPNNKTKLKQLELTQRNNIGKTTKQTSNAARENSKYDLTRRGKNYGPGMNNDDIERHEERILSDPRIRGKQYPVATPNSRAGEHARRSAELIAAEQKKEEEEYQKYKEEQRELEQLPLWRRLLRRAWRTRGGSIRRKKNKTRKNALF